MATDAERDLLIRLAEEHKDHPFRPCCDGETTLQDWRDAGFEVPHLGHFSRLGGTWWCDTCNSPYCDLA